LSFAPVEFEEWYNALELGLQCFDFLADGYICRVDLKRVLDEFKLPIGAMELELFLSK
jgi:Ca2+-binding EF-hand superfamily protein